MKKLVHIQLASAVIAFCATGQAQETAVLAPVAVNAAPIIEANKTDAFADFTTTLSGEQIRDLGALDLAAALRMVPGVQISRYNEVGSYSGDQGGNVYVRGIGASRPGSEIKTYVDGIPVYMGLWNHPLIDLLPLNGMHSVEIDKGPRNLVSGNAFAAVRLNSKRPTREGWRGELEVSAGSFSTQVLQGQLQGRIQGSEFSLALGEVSADGDRANADSRLSNAMGRFSTRVAAGWTLGASFLTVRNKVGDPGDNRFAVSHGGVGPYSFSNGVARNDSAADLYVLQVAHQHGDWKGELKIYQNEGHNNLKEDPNWGTFDSNFKMSGLRWQEELSPWQGASLVVGVDQETVSGSVAGPFVGAAVGTPFGFGPPGVATVPDFRVTSGFLGLSQALQLSGGWVLQPSAGMRVYSSSSYGSKTAPNVGIVLNTESLKVYASHSLGVLYPGAETYTLTRAIPMAFAADNGWNRLTPTEDRHSEVGLKWEPNQRTTLDVSVFQDNISKRYVWPGFYVSAIVNPASGQWSNQFPDYQIKGVEASLRHALNRQWSVFVGATTLDPSLGQLPYAPKQAVSVGVTGSMGGVRVAVDAQHQSKMYALTQDRGAFAPNEVPGFTVANVSMSYPWAIAGHKGTVYVLANNLFDAGYQYNAGYPMPCRNFRLGLTVAF